MRKDKIWWFFFAIFWGITTHLSAQNTDVLVSFSEANQAYEAQEFEKAASLYENLIQRGIFNGHIYYNLGNAHYRLGHLGPAIGAYLQALEYLPRDQDILANLQYARTQTKDQRELDHTWQSRLHQWSDSLSLREWLWSAGLTNGLFWLSAMVRLFYRREVLTWSLVLTGVAGLFFLGGAALHWATSETQGVILPAKVALRSEPHAFATTTFELHAGTETAVEEQVNGWVRLRFDANKRGWVERDSVMLITPAL